jgi:omega-6 fatty acid desaturase (delta-12 desaturase)
VLSKSSYDEIRKRLAFDPSPAMLVWTLVTHVAWQGTAIALSQLSHWLVWLIGQAMLAIGFFQAFALLHEAGHGNCSRNRHLNVLVGHLASVACFLPFYSWRYVHAEHHTWTGNPDRDPGLAIVKRAKDTGTLPWLLRASFRVCVPLGGLGQHFVYWAYPWTRRHRKQLSRVRALHCAASVLFLVCTYTMLARYAPRIITLDTLGLAIVLYLLLVELVNFPPHVGRTTHSGKLPLWQQHLATRSCNYPRGIAEVVVLNFNLHVEHHLFPNLPWYRLSSARALVKDALAMDYREARGLAWHRRARRHDLVRVLTGGDAVD